MRVRFSGKFNKTYDKAPYKIRDAFDTRLKFFLENPYHQQLNNHLLGGKYKGYRSINVTGDWRAIFSQHGEDDEKAIIFEVIGTHSQLYK
mgnify:CR=1 FL=1